MVADAIRRIHVLVSGRVQGVHFRKSAEREARALALRGWVRNVPDGRVELEAEGPLRDIDAMIVWLREGPPLAQVDGIELTDVTPVDDTIPFEVRPFEVRR